jgi:hypothetical protein
MGLCIGYIYRFGPGSFTYIYEHWVGLVTASVVFSFVQASALYYLSFQGKEDEKLLAEGGNSESHIYNVRCPLCSSGRTCTNHMGSSSGSVGSLIPPSVPSTSRHSASFALA